MISFLADRRFLVTGASSGIGRAVALLGNRLGATIIANGRDLARLEKLKTDCSSPDRMLLEPRDLAEAMDDLPGWVQSLKERYGKLRGLVVCAGFSDTFPLRDYSRQRAGALFDIHVHVPLLLARGLADRRNNTGVGTSMVFISSVVGKKNAPAASAYAGAKAALDGAMRCLSRELIPRGIRVNSIAPAQVNTPMFSQWTSALGEASKEKQLREYAPLGVGEPEDVAAMAVFLLSDAAKWITGETICLGGG